MKHALLSIVIAVLGMIWVGYLNFRVVEAVEQLYTSGKELRDYKIVYPMAFKMSGLIIGLIGIFFGIKGYYKTKPMSIVGIVFSFLLIVLTFTPIYQYFLRDSALDISIQNL